MFFASQISLDCTSLSWPLEDFHGGNSCDSCTSSPETRVAQSLLPCWPGWTSENPQHRKDWYGSLWSRGLTPPCRRLCTGYWFPSWPIQPWREHRHLLPLWGTRAGPGGGERPVYLHCTMFKGLEHSTSRVTWQKETKPRLMFLGSKAIVLEFHTCAGESMLYLCTLYDLSRAQARRCTGSDR